MIRKLIRRVFKLPSKLGGKHSKPQIVSYDKHGVRRTQISHAALRVTLKLQEAGFDAFVVGGAVRDLLLGLRPKDFDVATNATPEEVHRIFRRSRIIGRRFKIVHVYAGPETIEVTTFRGGGFDKTNEETGRIMSDNNFGTQHEDAQRRDFTVNALFYNPENETIVDYHNGLKDIKAKRLVMIGQPAKRYEEDPVRMLRAVRLATKIGFSIEEKTRAPIRANAYRLRKEPDARLFDEMLKILHSGHAYVCLCKLREEGLSKGFFPLLDALLDDKDSQIFIRMALENTDERIRQDKPVSVAFLLAALLWHQVDKRWRELQEDGMPAIHALMEAINQVEDNQIQEFAIPRKISVTMREIWSLQPRFENRAGQRAFRFIEQPRFRAAFDFLVLRAKAHQASVSLADWWTEFQRASVEERMQLVNDVKNEKRPSPIHKKRRRRRRKPQGTPDGGILD